MDKTLFLQNVEHYGEEWEQISDAMAIPKETCEETFQSLKKQAKIYEKEIKNEVSGTGMYYIILNLKYLQYPS